MDDFDKTVHIFEGIGKIAKSVGQVVATIGLIAVTTITVDKAFKHFNQ